MSSSNYSIGLQRLKPVHTMYGAICMPIRKLLMHWHHSSTSQLCIYSDGLQLVLGTRRKWPRPRRNRDIDNFSRDETETRRWYISRPRRRDQDHCPGFDHANLYGKWKVFYVVYKYSIQVVFENLDISYSSSHIE